MVRPTVLGTLAPQTQMWKDRLPTCRTHSDRVSGNKFPPSRAICFSADYSDGCRFSRKRLGGGCCGGRGNKWRGRERDREGRRMSLEPPRLNLGVRHNGKPRGVHRIRWESVRVLLPKVAYSFALRGDSQRGILLVTHTCSAF